MFSIVPSLTSQSEVSSEQLDHHLTTNEDTQLDDLKEEEEDDEITEKEYDSAEGCVNNGEEESLTDEEESSSDDDGGRVALAFDPSQLSGTNGLPQNGHDHLKLVQAERLKYPAIMSSPPTTTLAATTTTSKKVSMNDKAAAGTGTPQAETIDLAIEEVDSRIESPPQNGSKFDEDDSKYCDEVLKNFKQLREEIEVLRQGAPNVNNTYRPSQADGDQPDDDNNDDDVENPLASSQKQRLLIEMMESEKRVNSLLKLMELGHAPQVSSLLNKTQFELHKTLERMADQCEMTPNYCTIHTDWIYSLMAALMEPIEADICSTLRRLARLCMAKRDAYRKKMNGVDGGGECRGGGGGGGGEGGVSPPTGDNEFMTHNGRTSKKMMKKKMMKKKKRINSSSSNNNNKAGATTSGPSKNNGDENNEELARQLEEEEYTSSLLIICVVRHYFGQADLR